MTIVLSMLIAAAQPVPATPPVIRPVTERELAVLNIDRTIAAVYGVISGPAGQKRDWRRMKTLFSPNATLYAIGGRGLTGGSVDDYIRRSGPTLERVGFNERELSRRVEVYGSLAQVWSSYAGTSADSSVNVRGINSFQLVRQSDGRWLVHSILWQAEGPGRPLPADMERR